jgi:hypothetical protein
MTLKPAKILEILNAKREQLTQFDQDAVQRFNQYRKNWEKFVKSSDADIENQLADCSNPSAVPLEPLSKAIDGIMPFHLSWENREQSLAWVRDRLQGITTFAVDGSQIYPSKDLSLPIALIQVGWFENPHLPTGIYEKDTVQDILTPEDLNISDTSEPADRQVSFRRFALEIERLTDYMQAQRNREDCLVFFDGALVGTFAAAFDQDLRQKYVDCLLNLLRTSEECRVPLVGYVDTSYAHDLVNLLQALFDLPAPRAVSDAWLVNWNMEWGDRTPLFRCQRDGILTYYEEQRHQIAFTYLKANRDGYPVRVELPVWVYEADLSDRVLDWVRGEVIIGKGYPYVIETADQTAVLQTDDRQAFYRILQDWAEDTSINLRFSRKMVSKIRRR